MFCSKFAGSTKHSLTIAALCFLTTGWTSPASAYIHCGKASWYAMTSMTASGERASPSTMTAAHRTLPFGSKVRVTNRRNGKSIIVRINDRGPFTKGRIIDVTRKGARLLGFKNAGWTRIILTPVGKKPPKRACK